MAETLTIAQRRALDAVRAGKCIRFYGPAGNTLHGPRGIGSISLRRLEALRLIKDADRKGSRSMFVHVRLTKTGEELWRKHHPLATANPAPIEKGEAK